MSSPRVLRALTEKDLPYSEKVKPFNFVLAAHVAKFGHPEGVDPKHFQLIAGFTTDPGQWLKNPWIDVYSGKEFEITTRVVADARLTRVKSYRDVFEEYRTHPEPKSAGSDGAPCSRTDRGLLKRRRVRAASIAYVGKESNSHEEVESELVHNWGEVQRGYEDRDHDPWKQIVLPILSDFSRNEIKKQTGISPRHLSRLRNGWQNPEPRTRARITRALADLIREALGEKAPDDDVAACVVYARWKKARPRKRI